MTFDPTKPVRTKSGKSARIVCTDMKRTRIHEQFPIIGLVSDEGEEKAHAYTTDGVCETRWISGLDLVNIPEKIEGWVNVYRRDYDSGLFVGRGIFKSKKDARRDWLIYGAKWIACIHVSFEEGEGLS